MPSTPRFSVGLAFLRALKRNKGREKVLQALVFGTICLAAVAQGVPKQELKPKPGIFGRVVNTATHEPVRRANVKVYRGDEEWDEITDGNGRFRFPTLAPGEYFLVVHRDGFIDRAYKTEMFDFTEQKELPVEVDPQGLIAGKVIDGSGQPLWAQIQALAPRTPGEKIDTIASTTTNDLGEYRLAGLNPGKYLLRVTAHERRGDYDPTPVTMATALHGSASGPAEIAIRAGSVIAGIDFVLNLVRPATIRGTVRTETGDLVEYSPLWIMGQAGEGGHSGEARNGKFELRDVGPGSYTISARTLDEAAPVFAVVTVEVRGSDVDGVTLTLRPSLKFQGQVQVEGEQGALALGRISFLRNDQIESMGWKTVTPDKEGKFVAFLNPGDYRISFDASYGKFRKAVLLDGLPVTNWTIHVGESAKPRTVVITLTPESKP